MNVGVLTCRFSKLNQALIFPQNMSSTTIFSFFTQMFHILLLSLITTCKSASIVSDNNLCPKIGPLEREPEFLDSSDTCCYQEQHIGCGNLDFCFGIMASHPSSYHFNCCDSFPSCTAFKSALSAISTVKIFTIVDIAISFIIWFLALLLIVSVVSKALAHWTVDMVAVFGSLPSHIFRVVLQAANVAIGIAVLIKLHYSNILETTENLISSGCFRRIGDERAISDMISEIEGYRLTTIVEILIGWIIMVINFLQIKANAHATKYWINIDVWEVFLESMEVALAFASLIKFLLPAIASFDEVYNRLSSTNFNGPCVRSCCLVSALTIHGSNSPTYFPSISPVPSFIEIEGPTMIPSISSTKSSTSYLDVQLQALEALYNSTDGSNWLENDNWLDRDKSVCTWLGITCDVNTNHVREINLVGLGKSLNGTIPTEMGLLESVETLVFHGHDLKAGTLPTELAQLKNLRHFQFTTCQLGGTIPPAYGSLTNLEIFDVGWNNLHSGIPDAIGNMKNLREFRAIQNGKLRFEIPTTFGNLKELEVLDLFATDITGVIPSEIGSLLKLEKLNLAFTEIDGPLPTSFQNLTNLKELSLPENVVVSGEICLLKNSSIGKLDVLCQSKKVEPCSCCTTC